MPSAGEALPWKKFDRVVGDLVSAKQLVRPWQEVKGCPSTVRSVAEGYLCRHPQYSGPEMAVAAAKRGHDAGTAVGAVMPMPCFISHVLVLAQHINSLGLAHNVQDGGHQRTERSIRGWRPV